jgi:hypothetical protein
MNAILEKRFEEVWKLIMAGAKFYQRPALNGQKDKVREIISDVCGNDYDLLKTLVDKEEKA